MAYHEHLHQAFLAAHFVSNNLAGTWRNPDFGGEIDKHMLLRTRDLLSSAIAEIDAHLTAKAEDAA